MELLETCIVDHKLEQSWELSIGHALKALKTERPQDFVEERKSHQGRPIDKVRIKADPKAEVVLSGEQPYV